MKLRGGAETTVAVREEASLAPSGHDRDDDPRHQEGLTTMKRMTSLTLALVSIFALALPACVQPESDDLDDEPIAAGDDQERAVGTAEQQGAVGTAEQQGAAGNGEEEGAVGTAEQALSGAECVIGAVQYYTYSDATGTYKWDVTHNWETGKWYADEKKIGSTWRRQYVLTPGWSYCPSHVGLSEPISLKYGTTTMNGFHNCLTATIEEVHMPDKQRELHFQSDFFGCLP